MANSDQDILIRILTEYEKGGIEAAQQAAAALKSEVDDNSRASKDLSAIQRILSGDATKAHRVMSNLGSVMQGGTGSVKAMTNALRGMAAVLGAGGGLMLAISVIGLAIGSLVNLYGDWKDAAAEAQKASEEAAKEAARAAEESEAAMNSLKQAAMDDVTKRISDVTKGIDEATASAKRLSDALASLDDAKLGMALAELDAQLVGESDPLKIASINQQKTDLKSKRENEKIDAEIAGYERTISDSQEKVRAAGEAFVDAGGILESINEELRNLFRKKLADYYGEANIPENMPTRADIKSVFGSSAKIEKLEQDREVIAAARERAEQEYNRTKSVADEEESLEALKIEAARIRQQSLFVNASSTSRQTDVTISAINSRKEDEDAARISREAEDRKRESAARQKAIDDREKARTNDERLSIAKGQVLPQQRLGGQLYDGQAAAGIVQKAEAAINEAGQRRMAGEDFMDVMRALVSELGQMGAVFRDFSTVANQLKQVTREIATAKSQIKNSRN